MLKRLIRDGAIYGGSDALARVVSFLAFPIIAAELSSEGFGVLELAMTIVTLGGVVVRCGMNNAVQRFYWDPQTAKAHQPLLVTAGLFVLLIIGVVTAVSVYAIQAILLSFANLDPDALGAGGAIGVALLLPLIPWTQYLQDVLRLHFAPWKFLGYSIFARASSAALAAIAAVVLHLGVEGVLLAQAIVLLAALPLGLWLIRKDLTKYFDRIWAQRLIQYGAPLILTEAAFWLFSSIDRWMLAGMIDAQEVGIYSAAFRLSMLASFVALAFGMAWSPYAVKLQGEYPNRFKDMYAEILIILLVIMLFIGGGIALFSGELLALLLPAEFAGAAAPVAILTLCVVVQASQQITAVGISMSRKTHLFAYLVWLAAAINVLLNLVLIPQMGATGAAWATLAAHLFLTIGYLLCTQWVYPIPFSYGRLLWLVAIGSVLLVGALSLQSTVFSVNLALTKLVILIACTLLGWSVVRMRVLLSR
jgi:O-antigen/teichoic acid export membrane protein